VNRRPLRVLLFSTLYPNSVQPSHGIFVQTRLRHLLASGEVEARVIAPVPWFPSTHPRFGEYASFAAVPRQEQRLGVDLRHPRFVRLPKVGMSTAPFTLAASGLAAARRLQAEGFDFDLIDAHYFYPDGVAATLIGRALGKPVTITARGTDINLIPRHALPRRLILGAARRSAHMITVCRALKDALVELGAEAGRITVLRNGVDLALFRPGDRALARARFGMQGFNLASVGHLIERKGHHHVIDALASLPDVTLHIAGSGAEEAPLRARAQALGVEARVRFLGSLPQDTLRDLYNAADTLVLASSREGWANVLLEAMACGTPVVASNVWGTPEVVAAPEAGVLMDELSGAGVAEGVSRLYKQLPDRAVTRCYAEGFDWQATTQGQLDIFRQVLAEARGQGVAAHA
jgi:glycosyltransferase involved in cell wall biosynthesis